MAERNEQNKPLPFKRSFEYKPPPARPAPPPPPPPEAPRRSSDRR